MGFMIGFVLVFVSIIFVQSTPVVRQTDDSLSSLQGIDSDLDEILSALADILPPDQFAAFEQDLIQIITSAAAGDIAPDELELQVTNLLEQYLGGFEESRFDYQNFAKQFAASQLFSGLSNTR